MKGFYKQDMHWYPEYPELGTGVAKYRRKAANSVYDLSREERIAYADAIEKAIRAKHRMLHTRPTQSETASEPIGVKRLAWLNSQLLAYPAKERAARTPEQWRAMYQEAMKAKAGKCTTCLASPACSA